MALIFIPDFIIEQYHLDDKPNSLYYYNCSPQLLNAERQLLIVGGIQNKKTKHNLTGLYDNPYNYPIVRHVYLSKWGSTDYREQKLKVSRHSHCDNLYKQLRTYLSCDLDLLFHCNLQYGMLNTLRGYLYTPENDRLYTQLQYVHQLEENLLHYGRRWIATSLSYYDILNNQKDNSEQHD